MARATTKADLLESAQRKYEALIALISSMSEHVQQTNFQFEKSASRKEAHWDRDQNLRDVIVHLYEWHQLLLNWVDRNTRGIASSFLPEPYNWKNYSKMNEVFWDKHQTTSLKDSLELFVSSHKSVINLINQFSDQELFSKSGLQWTGSSTLGSYCKSATASHYDWAIKKIKLHKKTPLN